MPSKLVVRSVADHPPLATWLNKHNARLLWVHDGDTDTATVQCWRVGAGIAYVILHPAIGSTLGGWDIATVTDSNDIKSALEDAEARLGIARAT